MVAREIPPSTWIETSSPAAFNRGAGALNLGDHLLDKRLSAKSRLDRHDEDHVELIEDIDEGSDVRRRLEGQAGPRSQTVQLPGQAQGRGHGLGVERHRMAADLRILRCPAVRDPQS